MAPRARGAISSSQPCRGAAPFAAPGVRSLSRAPSSRWRRGVSSPCPCCRQEAPKLPLRMESDQPHVPAWGPLRTPFLPSRGSLPLPAGMAPFRCGALGGLRAGAATGGAWWRAGGAGVSGQWSCAERGGRPQEVYGGTAPAPESAAERRRAAPRRPARPWQAPPTPQHHAGF